MRRRANNDAFERQRAAHGRPLSCCTMAPAGPACPDSRDFCASISKAGAIRPESPAMRATPPGDAAVTADMPMQLR
ncbi:MAG: hypothetical protein OJF55_002778 [Rhodanobacteraceae bacterium]|nr:MAG: hypothetical protein OJF55_002778 [Rhodanobacteraceae bacterium]